MNTDEVTINNVKLKVWDLSGQETMRNTWKYYYEAVNGLVFVIDSTLFSKEAHMNEVRDTVHRVLAETRD